MAQDLKLDGGHAGKHKVSSNGIRSTKALIKHFFPRPGELSCRINGIPNPSYLALRSLLMLV